MVKILPSLSETSISDDRKIHKTLAQVIFYYDLLNVLLSFQEEDDTNYVEEGDVADVFDSDFDEDVCVMWFTMILNISL